MPDFDEKPWSDVLLFLRQEVVPVLLIILAAVIALRLARLFVHGVVKALLDREATEGTAQELSAVELKKRMDTLDALGANTLKFFIVAIAFLMILGHIGLDIGPAVAGLGVVGIAVGFGAQSLIRDYLNGALILVENQFARGDVVRLAGVSGTVEDFTLRRTTLRDLDGVVHTDPERRDQGRLEPDPRLVADQPGRDGRLRHGHRPGDRGRRRVGRAMAADPVWKRRVLEAPRVERVQALAETGVTLKILGTVRAADQWAAARRLPPAPARGLQRERHRDAGLAADGPDPHRERRADARPRPGPGRPRRRHRVGERDRRTCQARRLDCSPRPTIAVRWPGKQLRTRGTL